MSGVRHVRVAPDDAGLRLDRWFLVHYPALKFGRLQKLLRSGQVRVDGKRVKSGFRLEAGQQVRVPPLGDMAAPAQKGRAPVCEADAAFVRDLILYEDAQVFVLNKPHGLAVQGGSGTTRHLDGLLKSLPNRKGEAPRLVHRLDRDTSGCLLVARTRAAAAYFASVFRSRSARKIYWALVVGVPSPPQGSISCFLGRQATRDGEQMVVVDKGVRGAQHSMSYYSVTDHAGQAFSWVSLKPVTGRTHQLRVHMMTLGNPILDDPRYGAMDNWNWRRPEGLGRGLHLHARRLSLPLQDGRRLDVSAPLPAHMQQSFDMLGFDTSRYDRNAPDPEEA